MKQRLGIYIHIPFCTKKCGYCDFYSLSSDEKMKQEYCKALVKEIEREDSEKYKGFEVKTVYFGGGTPSLLHEEDMRSIIEAIRKTFFFSKEEGYPEITVECNPATVEKEKLAAYKEMGVNRLSIGLQSTDDRELQLLGRIHTYKEFLESYGLIREAGFTNVNVDLMSGLPSQTVEKYEKSVKEVIRLKPEHIASYSLILEEGTPFFKKYAEGKAMAKLLPDEEAERAMYYLTDERLKAAGYRRYEISNYAKEGYHSKHNTSYWERVPYLGFGTAAASQFGKERWNTIADLKRYLKLIAEGKSVRTNQIILTPEREIEETMFLGLRMEKGVDKTKFYETFHKDIYEVYGNVLYRHLKNELLEDKEGIIKLTERGVDVSNSILCDFLLD